MIALQSIYTSIIFTGSVRIVLDYALRYNLSVFMAMKLATVYLDGNTRICGLALNTVSRIKKTSIIRRQSLITNGPFLFYPPFS